MRKAIEIVEYLAGVHTQNLLALPTHECTTDEGRAFLDLWAEHLNKEVVLLADLRADLLCDQTSTEAAVNFRARAITWDHDEKFKEWTDGQYGFHIELDGNEPTETQYAASWGEGDCEHFESLGEAQAWCQGQIDVWVRSCAMIDQATESSDGVSLIAAERRRQVAEEGWSAAHDDSHATGELACAAACYAAPEVCDGENETGTKPRMVILAHWPWAPGWWKPSPDDRVRELTKAGALVAAEIDRLRRASAGG